MPFRAGRSCGARRRRTHCWPDGVPAPVPPSPSSNPGPGPGPLGERDSSHATPSCYPSARRKMIPSDKTASLERFHSLFCMTQRLCSSHTAPCSTCRCRMDGALTRRRHVLGYVSVCLLCWAFVVPEWGGSRRGRGRASSRAASPGPCRTPQLSPLSLSPPLPSPPPGLVTLAAWSSQGSGTPAVSTIEKSSVS